MPDPGYTTTPNMGSMDKDKIKSSFEQLQGMDEDQMSNMVNMMKSNPALMKSQYEAQMGTKLSDEQFDNMMNMMNPAMMRQAT